jgi:RNA polymerase sigma-70 factor (ECF subfamily)
VTPTSSKLAAPLAADALPSSDGELMAAVTRGDALAFRQLVDRHAPAVYRYAYRVVGRASEAEDVVQDVFVKVWTRAGDWREGQGALGAWLRRVTTNLCIDRKRRSRRMVDGDPPDRPDAAAPVDEAVNASRLARVAAGAVAQLPERQRAAIVLTYFEELPNAAAADAMQMNVKAFESLLVRARAALAKLVAAAGVTAADLGSAP